MRALPSTDHRPRIKVNIGKHLFLVKDVVCRRNANLTYEVLSVELCINNYLSETCLASKDSILSLIMLTPLYISTSYTTFNIIAAITVAHMNVENQLLSLHTNRDIVK